MLTNRKVKFSVGEMISNSGSTEPVEGLADRARLAERRAPRGTSTREGILVVGVSLLVFALLFVTFQARSWEWGGIISAGATLLFLMLIPVLAGARSRHERVHPRGWRKRLFLAGAWGTAVALVGGYLWRSGLMEVASPLWLTTIAALVAAAPLAGLGFSLMRGRR